MFDDILTNDKIIERICSNCNHASYILSNYPNKILCQKKRRHYERGYTCSLWEKRKYNKEGIDIPDVECGV